MSIVPEDADLHMQWNRWLKRQNTAARDHLIVHYSPLVKFVAGRIGAGLPSSVDAGDLIGSGVFGLMDAIDRFEPDRGVKFETFAVPRIRGAIYDGLRQLDWVPRSVRSRARDVERAFSELEHKLGRAPSDEELAEQLRITEKELAKWLSSIASTTIGPLDRAIAAGAEPAAADDAAHHSPSAVIEDKELSALMRDEIKRLPEREKLVLSLYYDEGLTLAEIGEVLGVTESRVSQIHTKSVLHLRSRLTAAGVG
ncbi:FliA/WhiG family RNA polymerase sigma factor [Ilumatobacter coccineus]|jgi:RNA polymerase sigma factor FliA|uniref:Putative RNA polymerase sigma factor n=1 Tax=Ilumatobacter coccineus (strain NBRC 103263 / KCTC 29153 / YM16-304) TaxID=1313172 RepID=A0A6C7ED57_ILUCY|nr:FliA/WhiG family RNA polymerase sigma factor [Ilumatobacter coccineus]BAN03065.1 putative RNA polymerase sigma factor [Ilumatobacter coccineus YM16-304]